MTTVISAALVRELRDRTSAPMMDCKKALEACNGDVDLAVEELRKSGIAKAGKKAGRIAAEGAVVVAISSDNKKGVMIETNCETDFVGRDDNFTSFVKALGETAQQTHAADVAALSAQTLHGTSKTVEEARLELVTKVGENVQIRRLQHTTPEAAFVGCYLHGSRIGVVVELDVVNDELARDVAMHIAASRPIVISPDKVPQELIDKEKEIYTAQAATSGKPAEIIEKMVVGRMKKFLDEVSLTGQPFVKDPDMSVGTLLAKHKATVLAFYRYEVGEGIEKVVEDFKEAVMSQAQGS
jgi:elongation factor Ts